MRKFFAKPKVPVDEVFVDEWLCVCHSDQVALDKPRAATLMGVDLVLWRSSPTSIHAWEDICIHRGAKLSPGWIENDLLVCPYHAWSYNAQGRCTRIPAHPDFVPPAKARANVFHVCEKYQHVWVCLGEPKREVPEVRFWDDPAFGTKAFVGPYDYRASALRAIENFCDVAHLGIVHPGLLGHPSAPEIADYEVTVTDAGVEANDVVLNFPLPGDGGKLSKVSFTYHIPHPLTAQLHINREDMPYHVWVSMTPVGPDHSIGWFILQTAPGASIEQLRANEHTILMQDIPVVESQRPELLPLDLQEELHLRSDRVAIAYRQWLKKRGVVFGAQAVSDGSGSGNVAIHSGWAPDNPRCS